MSHVRTQIRNQLVTYLTGLATTGANCFASRPAASPLQSSQLPALVIYTDGEDDSLATGGGPTVMQVERAMRVKIAIHARVNSGFDTVVDTILGEIEAVIAQDTAHYTVGGLARFGMVLKTVEDPEYDDSGDKVVARVETVWIATYRTVASTPTTAI